MPIQLLYIGNFFITLLLAIAILIDSKNLGKLRFGWAIILAVIFYFIIINEIRVVENNATDTITYPIYVLASAWVALFLIYKITTGSVYRKLIKKNNTTVYNIKKYVYGSILIFSLWYFIVNSILVAIAIDEFTANANEPTYLIVNKLVKKTYGDQFHYYPIAYAPPTKINGQDLKIDKKIDRRSITAFHISKLGAQNVDEWFTWVPTPPQQISGNLALNARPLFFVNKNSEWKVSEDFP